MPASSFQQQKLRVCEVCSAYLGLHDNDRRLADHFGGKLHLGFIQIREKLDQLKVCPRFSTHCGVRSLKGIQRKLYGKLRSDGSIISDTVGAESCCRQAGEEKPGALKKKRRKGEGGKNEEEVSPDARCLMCRFTVKYPHACFLPPRTRSRSREHKR